MGELEKDPANINTSGESSDQKRSEMDIQKTPT